MKVIEPKKCACTECCNYFIPRDYRNKYCTETCAKRQWLLENRAHHNEKSIKYYYANKDKHRSSNDRWRSKNKEKIALKTKNRKKEYMLNVDDQYIKALLYAQRIKNCNKEIIEQKRMCVLIERQLKTIKKQLIK